jgi:uncharacterized protein YifN (PemK superfamily)
MVKKRPVVVVSDPSKLHTRLATVVPLSSTVPREVRPWHHKLDDQSLPNCLRAGEHWAKCDLVTTVAFERLDRVRAGKDRHTGRRIYVSYHVSPEDLMAIRKAILHVLGLQHLTWPP